MYCPPLQACLRSLSNAEAKPLARPDCFGIENNHNIYIKRKYKLYIISDTIPSMQETPYQRDLFRHEPTGK